MEEKQCKNCHFWGPDCGFSDKYTEKSKFCDRWFSGGDETPVMKITYGGGKGCIFTPLDFCCKFFQNKKDCPEEGKEYGCIQCEKEECIESHAYWIKHKEK